MDGVVVAPRPLAALRREGPMHVLMIAVMALAAAAGTAGAMLLAALVLVALALGCAVGVRRSQPRGARHLAAQCLDLWAMALGMLALTIAPVAGHHGPGAGGPVLYAAIAAAWAAWRGVLLARRWASGRSSAASVAIMVASFAIMPLMHS